jgi:hypothetical protein
MTPQAATEILENASKLCKDIGAKGMAENLREVIKVIQDLEHEIFVRESRTQQTHEYNCSHVATLERKIYDLEAEIQYRAKNDAGESL